MDVELSIVLRQGTALKGSGLHQDELSTITYSTTNSVYPTSLDYDLFDNEARTEWAKIAARRRSNALQLKTLGKKTTSLSISTPTRGRPPKLTDLERDWLAANNGCFKCRKVRVDHEASACNAWAPANWVVQVPAGWDRSKPVPSPSTAPATPTPGLVGVRAVHVYDDDEIDLPESLADDSDDSDECAFPPLPVRVGSTRRNRSAMALADSGSSIVLISDKLVTELELVRTKLSRPKRCRVAIKGQEDRHYLIDHFVRTPLVLENGSWSAGPTTFLVASIEEPFDIILGGPFIKRHRLFLGFDPSPCILVKRDNADPLDLLAPVFGPPTLVEAAAVVDEGEKDRIVGEVAGAYLVQLEDRVNKEQKEQDEMEERKQRVMGDFDDLFPSALPPLTHDYLAKTATRHRLRLVDDQVVHNQRGFSVPRKWRESWKRMLNEHLDAGRLRPSTSPYASAAFVVPKKDPTADPRWVNDYRRLNANTVKDRTPLPLPDLVLADAALANYWGKIDMTNAFFQTPMHPDDIEKTAIKTPWGLFEWTVMPQGLCNAPATHQARVNEALRHLVGVCCQAFVDDIIIYSQTLEEHEQNCRAVLSALRAAGLYCIEADPSKVEKIKNWTRPTTVAQVRGFLGLVQYLRKFIPALAEHTAVLTPLTRKGLTGVEHLWRDREERAFVAIKDTVTSLPVLRPVDQDSKETIWLMTDASKVGVGAVLLQGEDWKTASPCGFYSRQYIAAEKNYPTHEQELLAIIAALKAWRIDLLGVHFRVLTDHDTLKHFQTQPTLSKRQARWTEVLADYDFELSYIPGKENAVADSLSRFSFSETIAPVAVCGISEVSISTDVVRRMKDGYGEDSFCAQVRRNLGSSAEFSEQDGLLFFEGQRLVVPKDTELREALLHDAHDALGHLGPKKTLASLSASFFWPRMSHDVLTYVASCDGCQRHKSRTTKRAGQLRSLPVPEKAFTDVALDFVGPLPPSEGKDMLLVVTDRLTGYARLLPCRAKDRAKDIAELVWRGWFCLFGLPKRLVSDRDKRSLHNRLGLQLQMSTVFHPETDGRSERSNKTAIQVLRQFVARHQKDWVSFLATTEYAMNTAVNDSTGKSPFELVLGHTPSILPTPSPPSSLPAVELVLADREDKIKDAREALAVAKVPQAEQANRRRSDDPSFAVGDLVLVDSADRRSRYKTRGGDTRAAKLFPRWDGPYPIVDAFHDTSTFRLALPPDDRAHPVFHSSKLKRYTPNDAALHPSREPPRPAPIDVEGQDEFEIEAIVDEKGRGRTKRYLVKWRGYPESENSWEPQANVEDTAALDAWEEAREKGGT
ncbi:hypothetical protein JCM5296_000410 [Sporobolomyces johnsonii]